jgi:GNAT superfamily N-acetyltransferase
MSDANAPQPNAPVSARQPDAGLARRVSFRIATPEDVAALVPLINEAYLREAWLLPPPRITRPALDALLARPGRKIVVAEIDGAPAGTICVSLQAPEPRFGLFAVAPAWQGRGVASMLVAEAERITLSAGFHSLALDCPKELGLPPFYTSLGYAVVRETSGSYYGDQGPFTLVEMRKELR